MQRISHESNAGQVTFTFGANSTAPLDHNATAESVATALNGLGSISSAGGVEVEGGDGDAWTVSFVNNGDRALLETTTSGGFTGDVTVVAATEGAVATNEVQTLSHDGTQGALIVSFDREQSAPIAYDASAAEVAATLNLMPSIVAAGGVTVAGSGTESAPYVVTFNQAGEREQLIGDSLSAFSGTPSVTGTGNDRTVGHNSARGAYTVSYTHLTLPTKA